MRRDDLIGSTLLDQAAALWWSWWDVSGDVPDWSVFKPFENPRLLPNIMVYERIGERFRCSIVGETVGSRLPVKVANSFIDETLPDDVAGDVSARLVRSLGTGVPNFVEKMMAWRLGRDLSSYRSLQLPFKGEGGDATRAISIINFRNEEMLA